MCVCVCTLALCLALRSTWGHMVRVRVHCAWLSTAHEGHVCTYMCSVLGSPQYACTVLGSPRSNWKDKLLYTLKRFSSGQKPGYSRAGMGMLRGALVTMSFRFTETLSYVF